MKTKQRPSYKITLEQILYGGIIALIVAMPFHAFLTIYFDNLLHSGHALQAWKEVIIIALAIIAAIYLLNKKESRPKLDKLNYIVVAIIILALAISLIRFGSLSALIFGLKTDLMPLVVFVLAQIVASRFDDAKVYSLVVWPAFIVSLLAILQALAIPPDFLAGLGYNSSTIIPAQYVDSTTMVVRAFSTLGGPNQLGAYLILPVTLVTAKLVNKFDGKKFVILATLLVGLYLTYSRSAWLGAALAILTTVIVGVGKKTRLKFLIGLGVAGIIGLLFIASRNFCDPNNTIQYYLLHGSCTNNLLKGSDQIRLTSLKSGLEAAYHNPLGKGLGTAGPASYHAIRSLITENWYLQIAIELGLAGLILFVAFFTVNAIALLKDSLDSKNIASLSLFASIIGLAGTNMFLHSFGDSTLAIILFAMLGIQHGRRQ